jgi:hypothetical protein
VKKSFIPSTVRIWNDLSPTIRNLQTISQFRLKIKGEQFRPPVYYGEETTGIRNKGGCPEIKVVVQK